MTDSNQTFESTDGMNAVCRQGLRDLLLACADTKLLLGYHYGEWTFGPPEIEAAVACCSLCQSELGHVRLLHGILSKHYGDDPDALVEERKASEFANVAYLDSEIKDWAEFVAANYIVDMAVTSLLHAMRDSSFKPLNMSLEKMLQEERYHIHHGQGWFRTLARKSEATKAALQESSRRALTDVITWFGPDTDEDAELVKIGIKNESTGNLVGKFLHSLSEVADSVDVDLGLSQRDDDTWAMREETDWAGWSPKNRRRGEQGPDNQILYHLRGSKNKVFKLN